MSNFFDPTNPDDVKDIPETPEGLLIILQHCEDIRSREKIYESMECEYAFWTHHLLYYTKREYWEDIFNNEGINGWAKRMNNHMQWAMRNEYIFKI